MIGRTDDRARGWLYFNLVLQHAGVTQNDGTDAALVELREYHRHDNLWEHVEPDVAPALAALRGRGLAARRRLERERPAQAPVRSLDLTKWFDHVLDSHEWGVEKPDPRLFQIALEQSRADARSTVHVGDLYHVDVMGARRAGLRDAVLFDIGGTLRRRRLPARHLAGGAGRVDRQAERKPDAEPHALTARSPRRHEEPLTHIKSARIRRCLRCQRLG